MPGNGITRREVLSGIGSAGVGAVATGVVGAEPGDGGGGDGRYIVGTSGKRGVAAAERAADSVKRVMDFGDFGSAVAGNFSDQALEALQKNPNVRYVERDGEMRAIAQSLPWGVDRVDADVVQSNGETGGDNTDGEGGAKIAILDTGIDSDHPDLDGNLNVSESTAYPACGSVNSCRYGRKPNDNTCTYAWDDDDDHGTHVAGTADAEDNSEDVVGVSTNAELVAVKVLDGCGSGSYSDIADGIRYAADIGCDVVNMSLGGSQSSSVADAVKYAYDKGVLLVAAAGNDGPCSDCVGYPAAEPEVIAVSSTAQDDTLSDFSSTGPEVELAAPGSNIPSTVPSESSSDGVATFSGTSMASPHVAGGGAQLMDNGYTNTEARDQLTSTAEDLGLASNEQGAGLLDVEAALGGGSDSPSAPTVDGLSASEVETSDGDAEFDVSWEVSDADGDLSSLDLTLTQDSDGTTEDTASPSVSGSSASGTTRLVAAGDEASGNSYTVSATVTDSNGNTGSDSTSVSETENTNAAPGASIDSLSNRSNKRWARYDVDWSASDSDGNLDSVVVEMLDSSGTVVDSVTNNVSGSSASGVDEVRVKGSANSIVVTATDTDGASGSDSRSI